LEVVLFYYEVLTGTLNGVMALILRYFTEFDSFRGALHCANAAQLLKMSS